MSAITALKHLRQRLGLGRYRLEAQRKAGIVVDQAISRFQRADVSVFHKFRPSPASGGHQFMRALWDELARRGLCLENNTISPTTRACLFSSFIFDFERLRRFHRAGCRMVHRVDGPVGVYRDFDDGSDRRVWEINTELADATIFQSTYSLQKHLELGYKLKAPCVIMNAADPQIFHPHGRIPFGNGRKIRLISTSWSDNPNKGAAIYQWLDKHLDRDRFEYTFVGRSKVQFENIRMLAPVPSEQLANLLRRHDLFVFASRNEACSNALIEALACGLPALYLHSGSSPEIVGDAGLGFFSPEEIPELLNQLSDEYEMRQAQIAIPTLAEVADLYLAAMGIEA